MIHKYKHRIKRYHLSVRPLIVCCGKETMLTISPLSEHARFHPGEIIYVSILPINQRPYVAECEPHPFPPIAVKAAKDGSLSFPVFCEVEQEFAVQLAFDGEKGRQHICTLSFFAAEEDLYNRRPFKGDFHVHTTGSDGRESPGSVIASYRRAGFDFMAITDHRNHQASIEGVELTKGLPIDISVFFGEEVHVPQDFFHVVNFGGNIAVNQYYLDNKEEVEQQLKVEMEEFDDPECPDKREYIYRRWPARKIKQGDGLAIFVHPHWITCDVCCASDAMTEYIFKQGDYDAFELLNGMQVHSNNMQTSFYFDQVAKGNKIPIVGGSDSHGTWEPFHHFEEQYTFIFAKDRSLDGVKEAVKNYYSVAVEEYHGEHFRIYGDYRMVRYAIFLAREYFPHYKSLCFEQGEALQRYLLGNTDELELLKLLEGRTDRFAAECFKQSE